ALRGAPLAPIAWAGVLTFSVATAAGIWGAYFAGRFTSDFTRSFVHWGFLALLLGATALLPSEWWMANPVRTIDTLVRTGWTPWLAAPVAGYLLLSVAGVRLVAGYVRDARSHEESG
ncbi:MAG: hypothetical protein K6W08_15855, partial [Firmicutes bacterium]|nr:hypothetical protein [Bacillota bacterium]